ncbi:MAG: 30S ribosome-binding factor RbfA [Actinomycetota bacterium]
MARRSADRRKAKPATKRHFPRTARLNALLQEIVADYLERVDDERIGFLTVTGVEVDADLNKAQVFVSTWGSVENPDPEQDAEVIAALTDDHRKPLQTEINRSARLRKTPEVVFAFDPAVRAGARIEGILATLHTDDDGDDLDSDLGGDGDTDTDGDQLDGPGDLDGPADTEPAP